MKGLLIYDAVGKARNEWFIERLIEAAEKRGHGLELVIYSDDGDIPPLKDYDFAIVRTIAPNLNEMLETAGIHCFNNAKTSRAANDKWQTYLFAKELGIAVMDTTDKKNYADIVSAAGIPFVLKAVDGHGGSEVFLVNNEQEYKDLLSLLPNKRLISQRLSSEVGVDMRVYVLGGRVLGAAKRTSKKDFRSNFSLGGNAEICTPSSDMLDVIEKVHSALKCDFVGIDFIRHNGKWILNEIEDVVGTRMLYSLTDLDAADEYIGYIVNKMNKG